MLNKSEQEIVKDRYLNINIMKAIFSLAIPAFIENLLQVFLGIVDTYFVSKLGSEAIAGVGVTNLIMNIYISFFIAIGVGTTAIVSRNIGSGDIDNANNATKQSIVLAAVIGLFFGIANLIYSKRILYILGAEQRVIEYALPYFVVVAAPSVILCVMMVLSSALRGAGDTKTPMKVTIISNIINAILDPILIFGVYNFNGLGMLGAGIATTLSRVVGIIILFRKLNSKKSRLKINIFDNWTIDIETLRSITKIGLPTAFERLIMRTGQLVYGALIIKLGTESYAAHNIAGNIESFSYLPALGFGVAASTLVGQNLGAGKPEESYKVGLSSYFFGTVFMVIIGAGFYIFAPILANIFTKDQLVADLVVKVLRIIALFQPFLAITLIITSALQGAGDTKFPMYSTLIGIWGVRVIGVYILGMKLKLGLVGVWIAYVLDLIVRGTLLMHRYIKRKWQNIEI